MLEEIALFDLPSRLARLIVKLSNDYGRPATGGGIRIDMKLSQRDLATLVASSRETVNKQLRGWRERAWWTSSPATSWSATGGAGAAGRLTLDRRARPATPAQQTVVASHPI